MSLYVIQGRGPYASKTVWIPGDPGIPTHADSKEELLSSCPLPEPVKCRIAECDNMRQVWAGTQYRTQGRRWYWFRRTVCHRCRFLSDAHGLGLAELIAMWDAQNGRCYRCFRQLVDPRTPDHDGRKADSTRVDHDHRICPQEQHSCDRCRRGLACNICNTQDLSETSAGLRILPKGDDLVRWLEFLGPADRDRLRQTLALFPEQPVRTRPRRQKPHAPSEVIPLFGAG